MTIPRLPWPDDTLRFLRDGYAYGSRGFAHVSDSSFRTRMLGRPVLVIRGLDAARFFYEGGRFSRSGSMPTSVAHLLQDEGSVQRLEGPQHLRRKRFFLDSLDDHSKRADLTAAYGRAWNRRSHATDRRPTRLLDHSAAALCDAALEWVGADDSAPIDSADLMSMIDNAGRFGVPNWMARLRRRTTEHRVTSMIEDARRLPPDSTPLSRIAHFDEDGMPLALPVATVELLNLLRPIVAVAHFATFAALALHRHPEWRETVSSDASVRRAFAQEVRRYFPFFPVVAGTAMRELRWQGEEVPVGSWVMLDLYGTDHFDEIWNSPRKFDPNRFLTEDAGSRVIVAQGTGDYAGTHHCPGEPVTVDLLERTLLLLTTGPGYSVPPQDLRISLRRFPAVPESGFMIRFD